MLDIEKYLFDNVVLCQLRLQLLSGWHAFTNILRKDQGISLKLFFNIIKQKYCNPKYTFTKTC